MSLGPGATGGKGQDQRRRECGRSNHIQPSLLEPPAPGTHIAIPSKIHSWVGSVPRGRASLEQNPAPWLPQLLLSCFAVLLTPCRPIPSLPFPNPGPTVCLVCCAAWSPPFAPSLPFRSLLFPPFSSPPLPLSSLPFFPSLLQIFPTRLVLHPVPYRPAPLLSHCVPVSCSSPPPRALCPVS